MQSLYSPFTTLRWFSEVFWRPILKCWSRASKLSTKFPKSLCLFVLATFVWNSQMEILSDNMKSSHTHLSVTKSRLYVCSAIQFERSRISTYKGFVNTINGPSFDEQSERLYWTLKPKPKISVNYQLEELIWCANNVSNIAFLNKNVPPIDRP